MDAKATEKKPKKQSRGDRWTEAANAMQAAAAQLLDVQAEYQEWLDGVPENLQNGATAEKLQAICDLDIQGAMDTADEAAEAELPSGFGRD